MTRLRHQLLETGEVLVALIGPRTASQRVTASEAKRFAWAILNDLDPDEADANGYIAPAIAVEVGVRPERDIQQGPWQQDAIVALLADGEMTTNLIASRMGMHRNAAAVQMNRLRARGRVRQLTIGRPGYPSTWALPLTEGVAA